MPASTLDVVLAWLTVAVMAWTLVRRMVVRRRSWNPVAVYSVTRWAWTVLLVLGVVAIVLDRGQVAASWLITIFAALQTLLTWVVHVLARQAQKSPEATDKS